jgi:hypothetical protein
MNLNASIISLSLIIQIRAPILCNIVIDMLAI